MVKYITFQETEHGKSYILLWKILTMLIHIFIIVKHLPCRGLAAFVKTVHLVGEWEFTRLEFITAGGGEEGIWDLLSLKYDGV